MTLSLWSSLFRVLWYDPVSLSSSHGLINPDYSGIRSHAGTSWCIPSCRMFFPVSAGLKNWGVILGTHWQSPKYENLISWTLGTYSFIQGIGRCGGLCKEHSSQTSASCRKLEIDDRTCTKVDFLRVWELSFWVFPPELYGVGERRLQHFNCLHSPHFEGMHRTRSSCFLGTGFHTFEDLLAHSNWHEIALRKMGYEEVFCHVGDNGLYRSLSAPWTTPYWWLSTLLARPALTGTFGGEPVIKFILDFLHSLVGEAQE